MEEPPPHAIFILATTEIHKIPATVLSRCQRHEFRRLPVDDIVTQLKNIVVREKIVAEPEALTLVARQATGSLRDAISLLDQLASTGHPISLAATQDVLGPAASQTVLDLVDALRDRRPAAGLGAIHKALDSGADPRLVARQVVDYLRLVLLVQMGNESQVDLPVEARAQVRQHAQAFPQEGVLRLIRLFNAAATDLRGGWQPSLPLELALAEALESPAGSQAAAAKNPPPTPRETPPEPMAGKAAGKPAASKPASHQEAGKSAEKHADKTTPSGAPDPKPNSSVSLDQVNRVWKQVCATIKPQSSSLNALLNSCKLLEVKDGILMLGFASELLRSKADTPDQMKLIHDAIADALGIPLPVRCVITTARKNAPPDVKQNGMVAAALKAGGEIVDIQE